MNSQGLTGLLITSPIVIAVVTPFPSIGNHRMIRAINDHEPPKKRERAARVSVFIHSDDICASEKVGDRTRVPAFAYILPGAQLGRHCDVDDVVPVESDVRVGDRVTIEYGVQPWDDVTLEDDVFVYPNTTSRNDPFPRSKQYPTNFARITVQDDASIGAEAIVLPGVTAGTGAVLRAGSGVTRDVPEYAIVVRNPARIKGDFNTTAALTPLSANESSEASNPASFVCGVSLHSLTDAADLRRLCVIADVDVDIDIDIDIDEHVPFFLQQFFSVSSVPTEEGRGAHAHRVREKFLMCLNGSVHETVDHTEISGDSSFNIPEIGLSMPPVTRGTQCRYPSDALLLVLASHHSDRADHMRDYDEYIAPAMSRAW